jgi:signal transduction histidine kinase
MPAAWQHPERAHARITLDGKAHVSPGFRAGPQRQTAPIVIGGLRRGVVEVCYAPPVRVASGGKVFLSWERRLIEGLAREVALIVERRRGVEDRERLQKQLRHADRLATIGQLGAGVAHELNEPLGSILGFAQLARKVPGLPAQAEEDLGRIVGASLRAREIIRKLLLFARQMPPRKTRASLNEIVDDGLVFLGARCAKEGIVVARSLDPALPAITADAAQVRQVVVNLCVNAMQAMPGGGTLTVGTRRTCDAVTLTVADTGTGMTPEVQRQIFLPFFTTKEVGQGTGLGLSVAHGIVAAHGGEIRVESAPGRGTRFEITFPGDGAGAKEAPDGGG